MNAPPTAISSPLLALVSTVHLGFLVLRHHRSGTSLRTATLLLPALVLAVSPWLLPAPLWLAVGLTLQLAWFVACERLLPAPVPAARPALRLATPPAQQPSPARPSPPAPAPTPAAAGFVPAPVLEVFQETEDIKTFRLARPAGLVFQAGQFVTVRVQVDGKPLVRCYSISSAPEASGYLEISVKRLGIVSGMLHATARPGSSLSIKGPAGVFTYPEGDDRPLVFIAGGVGITPLMSMLRHGLASHPTRPLTLVFSVRNQRQIAYRHELEWLPERFPHLRTAFVIFEGPHATSHFSGVVNEALLTDLVPEIPSSIYMICGPQPMMDAMTRLLSSLGVPEAQIRYEVFQAAIALADHRPAPAAEPVAAGGAGLRLTLARSGVTVAVSGRQTLLDAADAGGVALPRSCRSGICLTCRTRLVSGEADFSSDFLDDADRRDGYILPCVSFAKSDCVLDA